MDWVIYPVFRLVVDLPPHQPVTRYWVGLSYGAASPDDDEGRGMAVDFVLGRHDAAIGVVLVPREAMHDAPSARVSDWMLRTYPMFARD